MRRIFTRNVLFVTILVTVIFPLFGNIIEDAKFSDNIDIKDTTSTIESLLSTSIKLQHLDIELSLSAIHQALFLASHSDNKKKIAECQRILGNMHSISGRTDIAISELKKALNYYESSGQTDISSSILIDMGLAYQYNDQFSKSLVYFNSALANYNSVNDKIGMMNANHLIGLSHELMGNFNDATTNYKSSLALATTLDSQYSIAQNYIRISNLQITSDSNNQINNYLQKAISISMALNNKELQATARNILAKYYKSIGDDQNASIELKTSNSLLEELTNQNKAELEKFVVSIADINNTEEDDNTDTIVFWVVLILMLIIIFYLYSKLRQKSSEHNIKIERTNAEIKAFNASLSDLEEKIKEKSKERSDEIENEISRNKSLKTAITNSQNSLNNVNQLKDKFLSKISHEIRTPLSGILGFAEILENQLALDEEEDLFDYAKSITDSGMSLVSLLNNLLDISRLNSNNIQLDIKRHNPLDLVQSVIDNFSAQAKLKGLKLIYDSNPLPDVFTDLTFFTKIVSLVLSNSVKFTEKGFIKISNDIDKKSERISIIIKDTGIGIDKVYMDQVFEPYRQESLGYSTSYQGAGLGLPLAKKMTTKLGGEIILESEISVGTMVTISIPINLSDVKKPEQEPETIAIKGKPNVGKEEKTALPWETLKVLVVEDDKMNQLLYRKILKSAKFLEIAKDGKVALEIVEKNLNDNNFDVVLMDINLPAPWDGISLMKEIRNKWPVYEKIPFVAQTAYAITGNRKSLLGEGFDEYLTKPIIKNILIDTVRKVTDI